MIMQKKYLQITIIKFIFTIGFIAIGLFIYKDYGFGTDEHINRKNGEISFNFVTKGIEKITNVNLTDDSFLNAKESLNNYKDKDYGVAFDLPAMMIEKLLNIESSQNKYLMRHLLTHALFLISLIYFFKLIKNRYLSDSLGLIGVIFLYVSPRIFAESFYNNKDIVFMSLFIIGIYYSIELIRKKSFRNYFFAALSTAIAIDVRIIGIILPCMVTAALIIIAIKNKDNFFINDLLKITVYYFFPLIFAVILMWPWLWESPISNFIEAFQNMAKFRWLNWVLYRGNYYPSSSLPWHYLPVWVIVTTPILYLTFFIIGFFLILKRIIFNKFKLSKNLNELIDLMVLSVVIVPLFAVILMKSIVYDGWRQFYFLYPALIYVAINGLNLIYFKYKKISIAIIVFAVINTAYWMVKFHPFQYVYFNTLAGEDWNKQFEMDYWGISNFNALRKILMIDDSQDIKIYGLGNTSVPQSFLLLSDKDVVRISQVLDYKESDYIITNYRYLGDHETIELFKEINKNHTKIFDMLVDNKSIGSVYKK